MIGWPWTFSVSVSTAKEGSGGLRVRAVVFDSWRIGDGEWLFLEAGWNRWRGVCMDVVMCFLSVMAFCGGDIELLS